MEQTIQKTQDKVWKTLDRISAMDEKARQEMAEMRARQDVRDKKAQREMAEMRARLAASLAASDKKAQRDHEKAQREMAEMRARLAASLAASDKKAQRDHEKARQEMAEIRDSLAANLAASHKKANQEMADLRAGMAASEKRTEREFKKAKELFIGQWGMLVESLVEGDLIKQLKKRNIQVYGVGQRMHGRMHITDSQGRRQEKLCEIDLIAKNGKEIVAVEVKTSLKTKDVDKFLGILKYFTQYLPEYKDNIVYGAVAYLKVQRGAELYAEKKGLFVIKATGDSSSIVNRPNFKPKVFS